VVSVLPGWKTYIVAAIAGAGAFAVNLGWVSAEQWVQVEPVLLGLGLWFARRATGKVEKQIE
jgi:hypothetical protein